MLKRGFYLLLLTGLSACAASSPTLTRQRVVKVLSTQVTAWNQGDVAGFMQGYWRSDSLVFIGQNGPTYGWQPTLDNYRRTYPDVASMGKLTFSGLRVTPIGRDVAQVVGRWHLARPTKGDTRGNFLLVFRRINGQWVIVADHSS